MMIAFCEEGWSLRVVHTDGMDGLLHGEGTGCSHVSIPCSKHQSAESDFRLHGSLEMCGRARASRVKRPNLATAASMARVLINPVIARASGNAAALMASHSHALHSWTQKLLN